MLNYRSDLTGKCFVEFYDADSAAKAMEGAKEGVELNGEQMNVNLARAKGHRDSKQGKNDRTLWVGNVDYNAEEWKLEDYFSESGEVERVNMPRD
jgi:RNA recognition motif-containing protein